jgi:hypothetical protein
VLVLPVTSPCRSQVPPISLDQLDHLTFSGTGHSPLTLLAGRLGGPRVYGGHTRRGVSSAQGLYRLIGNRPNDGVVAAVDDEDAYRSPSMTYRGRDRNRPSRLTRIRVALTDTLNAIAFVVCLRFCQVGRALVLLAIPRKRRGRRRRDGAWQRGSVSKLGNVQ